MKKKKYVFAKSDGRELNSDEMIDFFEDLVNKYPIISIEDALDEEDWDGWVKLKNCGMCDLKEINSDCFSIFLPWLQSITNLST